VARRSIDARAARCRPRLDAVAGLLGEAPVGDRRRRVTRTFLFTDIVSSTELVQAMGDEAWEQLLERHDEALRAAFGQHGGRVVSHTGDGFFVAFDDAPAAIGAAIGDPASARRPTP
jgi:class 3 adenylate cyclase